jgi:hypothetical protein
MPNMLVDEDEPDTATDSVETDGGIPGTGMPEGATDSLLSPPPEPPALLPPSAVATDSG